MISDAVNFLNGYIWSFPTDLPWLVVLLLGTGLFITLKLGFIQLKQVGHAIKVVAGKYDDPEDEGDINHFQALTTALSATVGIGNIAGVATAIHYGGPGALFWMWVTAGFGMALKFAECTLSMQYRQFDSRGDAAGGPMYYIEHGLGPKWKPLAILFAICGIISSFGSGNMNQANTIAVSASSDLSASPWVVGIISAVVVGGVILGGIRRIGAVSSKLAPMMAILYVLGALIILLMNVGEVPGAFATIVSDAFNPKASLGGSVAGVFSVTLLWGVKRGLFSNEAGQGSAPIAHAAAKTKEPVREGAVAMLGPLIDTLIICTMTGLVIVITGVWEQKRTTNIPLEHVEVVQRKHLSGDGDVARILNARENTDGDAVQFTIGAGHVPAVAFIAADGIMTNARLVGADGKPFEGTVKFQPATRTLAAASEGVMVRGEALQNSSALTAWAFKRGLSPIGDWGNWVVTLSVFLFALSTMISWSYYGDRCVEYLVGSKGVLPYRAIYVGFVFLGSILALEVVWAFGDLALGLMAIPNLIAVLMLSPKVVDATKDYFERMAKRDTEQGNEA
jgi:AGCS family alanine or glycine:cation symporter